MKKTSLLSVELKEKTAVLDRLSIRCFLTGMDSGSLGYGPHRAWKWAITHPPFFLT